LGEIVPIAGVDGVRIFCPIDGYYAFYNSPYPAHRISTGIDIYTGSGFGEDTFSPISGEVILVRKVRAPQAKLFKDHGHDTVILIKSQENPQRIIKVLHIEPKVKVGEVIEAGQPLGTLIRSGYFGYSTQAHIHLEVRKPEDLLRARGGLILKRLQIFQKVPNLESLEGVVNKQREEYIEVGIRGVSKFGLQCKIGDISGVLDGGIPYYGWLGAHTNKPLKKIESVILCGKKLAHIFKINYHGCLATCQDTLLLVNGKKVGLSTYLFPNGNPRFYLIALDPCGLNLKQYDCFNIEIISS
jgi:hypothetical protein